MNDSELLHAWATRRDEAAFAELVRRHLDLVYASAHRQVGASPLADDVAQAVFLVLARKAGSLGTRVVLSGWLFRTTRFVAARALRAEQRRSHHESLAAMQPPLTAAAIPEHWEAVEPHLDAALDALPIGDRDAVLLRFFEGKPLRAVGEQLGVNEEAAKKRVSRAVEKMRTWLARRGVVLTAVGLVTLLGHLPTHATPIALAGRIVGAVMNNTASVATTALSAGATRDWWSAQTRHLAPWAVAALLVLLALHHAPRTIPANVTTRVPTNAEPAAASPAVARIPAHPASNILLNVRSAVDHRPLVAQLLVTTLVRQGIHPISELVTDAQGNVEISAPKDPSHSLALSISAPGHVPVTATWHHYEFTEPVLTYQCNLEPGVVLTGEVKDEAGQPVPNAKIQFGRVGGNAAERQSIFYHPRLNPLTTDAQGRFHSDQLPQLRDRRISLAGLITHPDHLPAQIRLHGPDSAATHQVIVLQRGLRLAGRVEGPDGTPVPDAGVMPLNKRGLTEWWGTTDNEGWFVLGGFPPGEIKIGVSARGYLQTDQTVRPGTNEILIRLAFDPTPERALSSSFRMAGTVTDAKSGEPVPRFRVLLTNEPMPTRFLGEGYAGHFDWPMEDGFAQRFKVEVEADGYEAATSDLCYEGEKRFFRFQLQPGGMAHGRVVDADGQPAVGAAVGINGPLAFVGMGRQTFSANGVPQTVTDAAGLFSLSLKQNTESLSFVHKTGFAQIPASQAAGATVRLQPWGAIEGVVLSSGQPVAAQKVILRSWLPEQESEPVGVNREGLVITDAQGRFRFDHVPPGPAAVSRYYKFSPGAIDNPAIMGFSAAQRVDVQPGGITEVTLAGFGRTVTGRLILSQPVTGHDWRWDLQKLEESRPDLPAIRFGKPQERDYPKQLRADLRRRSLIQSFYPDVQADGSFRLDDVPAGNYLLRLHVSTPLTDPNDEDQQYFRPELGKLEIPVTISEGDSNDPPLDLGTITIPVKQP